MHTAHHTTAGGEPAGILECELLLSLWHLECILCSRGYRPAPARDGVGWGEEGRRGDWEVGFRVYVPVGRKPMSKSRAAV